MARLPSVQVRRESVVLPTYEPQSPDPCPMFLENRVYQGSSGRVYPLPCIDRVAEAPRPATWEAVFLENEFILVMLLPEIGGRIHRILDKTNNYDAIYHQPVIKPALVGLAGPWCSGGIEFNWPQHHRPSTFMPTDVVIEHEVDGSATVWMSDHDPMSRMKGMHGVRLRPGRSLVELRARAYNRTTDVQSFLWWANVATRVHEGYQSFFPPDVTYVADHARRAISTFPHSSGTYYGVDYAARARDGIPAAAIPRQFKPRHASAAPEPERLSDQIPDYRPDDLSWYANIPVPTSYMAMGSSQDFCGGYDYKAQAGLIHVANHHIAPGKKQWTWGNHEFGYAWDRNLTDRDAHGEYAPYIELMAGVYTDNQPDFSFLQPGETKSWSQFWYPFRAIGPVQHANADAALSLRVEKGMIHLGVAVTAIHLSAVLEIEHRGTVLASRRTRLTPASPGRLSCKAARAGSQSHNLTARVIASDGTILLTFTPGPKARPKTPPPAAEPPGPAEVASTDELFLIGLHLEQYRHATRLPETYWREALRRDPGDSRCHLALGRWQLRRGELESAENHLRASIDRITSRNANPYDGEAHYQLGQCLRLQAFQVLGDPDSSLIAGRLDEAYAAFYKATWNHAWQAAGFHALAEIDCFRVDWSTALDHLDRALRVNVDNLRARNLKAIVLRRLERTREADALLADTLAIDPIDWWARHLSGQTLDCDNQVRLDIAHDCARAGFFEEALAVLARARFAADRRVDASLGTEPLVHYTRAWLTRGMLATGRTAVSKHAQARILRHLQAAERACVDYCFPARIEEIAVLRHAIASRPEDARARACLGHLLYDRRRYTEAIALWERAVALEESLAVVWRNLGIAHHNISGKPARALRAYARAVHAAPLNARLLYERDQLWKRLRIPPARRLRALRRAPDLVAQRDDLSLEYCALCNQTGRPADALAVLSTRRFQPWEGGEGQALGQHVRTHLLLGQAAFTARNFHGAAEFFRAALSVPQNLGEARHLLASPSDIHFWLGCALERCGEKSAAWEHWTIAARFTGDFQSMRIRAFSEMTYFCALASRKLGRTAGANRLLRQLQAYARNLARTPASVDYFATSLPTMLLFNDDLQARQLTTARFLEGQALLGLGHARDGRARLREVLRRDPSHALAADLLAHS